jgi:Ca2+-binding RTX toxin-like protein
MTTLILSQSLLEADLSAISSTSYLLDSMSKIDSDISGLLNQTSFFDSKPTQSGKTLTYNNPTFNGLLGEYTFAGALLVKYDNNNNFASSSSKFTGANVDTGDGHLVIKGTVSSVGSVNNYNYSTKYSSFSYQGDDGTQWTLLGSVNSSYKSNLSNYSYSANFTSFTQKDSAGNSLAYSGNMKYDINTADYIGYFTSMTLMIGNTKISSSGLQISYNDFKNTQLSTITDLLPSILLGNDTISLSAKDAPNLEEIHGYSGNDKITGSSNDERLYGDEGNDVINGGDGNDLISGGAGSDKLTGGKGSDVFSFNSEDFFSQNSSGDLVFNKSIDTITDFNLNESDTLIFSELGSLAFYATLNEAKSDEATLFYVKGSGKIYLNTDSTGDKYTATPIITLTGNPKVNAELTDWDYPTA